MDRSALPGGWPPYRVALAAIVALAVVLRVWGINFDFPHPDEITNLNIARGLRFRNLNPHFFVYPSLFSYLLFVALRLFFAAGRVSGYFPSASAFRLRFLTDPLLFYLPARVISVVFGSATIILAYRLGVALAGRAGGLVAALLVAVNPLHVRNSHLGTPDVLMTALVTFALSHTIYVGRRGRRRDFVRAGLGYGLAISSKYPAVLFLAALPAAAAWPEGEAATLPFRTRLARLGMALATATASLSLTSPYVFLEWRSTLRDLQRQYGYAVTGFPPEDPVGPAWAFHATFSLPYGLGAIFVPILVAAAARLAARGDRPAVATMIGVLAYFIGMGTGGLAFSRYMVPVIPVACALMGTLATAPRLARMAGETIGRAILTCGLLGLLATPLYRSIRQDVLLARTDSRTLARAWVLDHVPPGATVARVGARASFTWVQLPVSPIGTDPRGPSSPETLPSPWYTVVNAARLSEVARTPGVPLYVMTQEHPLRVYAHLDPDDRRALERDAELLWEISPFRQDGPPPVYEKPDAYFLPFARFEGVSRPGPAIRIFRMP